MNHLIFLIIDCIILGIGAGIIYGLFGGGSGLVMAPGYYYVLRHFQIASNHRMQIAIATTAAASAFLGIISARVQSKAGQIDKQIVRHLFPGLLIGTLLAVILLNVISSEFLKRLFGVVVTMVAIWLWFYNQEKDNKQWSLKNFSNHIKSFFIGLLWFLLGIAVFTVPYLHKCGINLKKAIGTATVIGSIFSAVAATLLLLSGIKIVGISKFQLGYINILLLFISLIPSMAAGYFGSKLSHKIPPKVMKKTYALLILIVGLLMI